MLSTDFTLADSCVDEDTLLDIAAEIGFQLSLNGAETFRIEESIYRILKAYGFDAQVYAIPTYLHISIRTNSGKIISRMCRIGDHGTDMDGIELYSGLSRRICEMKPNIHEAELWLSEAAHSHVCYKRLMVYFAHFLAGSGFSMFFGGSFLDSLCGGICALLSGIVEGSLSSFRVNRFFRTAVAGLIMAFPAYFMAELGIIQNPDMAIVGAIMPLIPGLLFTNAMRDIFYGDTISALNRILQVLLLATAIALGTAVAFYFTLKTWGISEGYPVNLYSYFVQGISCFIACIGFAILFNVHGKSVYLCATGGLMVWLVYEVLYDLGYSELVSYFWASIFSGCFSECMARIRKKPACAYLVVSLVPLIPGSGLYNTMRNAVNGDAQAFISSCTNTILLAAVMCIGIIAVNSIFRLWGEIRLRFRHL